MDGYTFWFIINFIIFFNSRSGCFTTQLFYQLFSKNQIFYLTDFWKDCYFLNQVFNDTLSKSQLGLNQKPSPVPYPVLLYNKIVDRIRLTHNIITPCTNPRGYIKSVPPATVIYITRCKIKRNNHILLYWKLNRGP